MLYLLTSLILAVYLALVWFLGERLHLAGTDLVILRMGLALIGVLSVVFFVWFYRRIQAAKAAGTRKSAVSTDGSEIQAIVREASRRLKNSAVAAGARLENLPLIFVLGESGSTKTTTVIHSALDPELLSGHVYQDNQVLPTRLLNVWYSRQAVLVDPSGSLMTQSADWKHLLKLLAPARLAAFGRKQLAPRAAVVCFDCEAFLRPGASESTLSSARKLSARLHEISHGSGISFPVYVLFTKMDRITFFREFVRGMNNEEASEVLGATLPVRSLSAGVYAEEETRRLTKAFDEIFYSLAGKRLDLLAREYQADKLPGIYEFPREMRKIRRLLVQFLVDLARPSQLHVNPFLRGFYFSGVRPVVVEEFSARAGLERQASVALDADATRIFTGGTASLASAAAPTPAAASRRVPQWTFLSQLFNGVIVEDRVALAASRVSSRVNFFRRVFFALAGALAALVILGLATSFVRNSALKSDVREAVADLRSIPAAEKGDPSFANLAKLDRLRADLAEILRYRTDGVPWSMRWGLYIGDDIYAGARRVYYQRFQQLLFADAQSRLLADLRALPDKPGLNDAYENNYNELRAYLITTSNHDKSTREFLSPALLHAWLRVRPADPDRAALASRQFDFYSTDLVTDNPFSSANDTLAIARARNFLAQFAGIDRYYLPLLAKASERNPDLTFADQFHDAAGVVISNHRVRGAFTRGGFRFMQEAIANPAQIAGEEWVLGRVTASELDPVSLQQKMRQRYYQDFVNEWRTVLETSSVARYRDSTDADRKLEKLTGPTSPLLEVLRFVSYNTDVGVSDLTDPFQPVVAVEPSAPADEYQFQSNKPYVDALAKLKGDLSTLAHSSNPSDPAAINQALASAGNAKATITQIMGMRIDQRFHTEALVRTLLEEPITSAEALLGRAPKEGTNAAGREFCGQFNSMLNKYPFNPGSREELSTDQLNAVLEPSHGALWSFYNSKLSQLLVKEGSHYAAAPGGAFKVSQPFLAFFNRAADLSSAFYPNGSATPHFSYTLKQLPSNVEDLVLKIGGETLSGTGLQKTFSFTGSPADVQVSTRGALLNSSSGTWAVFHFIAGAHAHGYGNVTYLEWIQQSNGQTILLPGGKPESYDYQLQVAGFNPFRAADLSGLRCVSTLVP